MMLNSYAPSGDSEQHDMQVNLALYRQCWLNKTSVKQNRGLTVPQAQDAVVRTGEDGATAAAS